MKLAKIFLAFVALFAMSCDNISNGGGTTTPTVNWENEGSVVGEWKLTSLNGKEDAKPQIYLSLNSDGTFEMYQKAFSLEWKRYEGTYSISADNLLCGVYSDGEEWSANYKVDFAYEPNRIRLTKELDNKEISIYTETTIPNAVIEEAQPYDTTSPEATTVRSVVVERFL